MGLWAVDLYDFLKEFAEHVYVLSQSINEISDIEVPGFGYCREAVVPLAEGRPVSKISSTVLQETRGFLGKVFWSNTILL